MPDSPKLSIYTQSILGAAAAALRAEAWAVNDYVNAHASTGGTTRRERELFAWTDELTDLATRLSTVNTRP